MSAREERDVDSEAAFAVPSTPEWLSGTKIEIVRSVRRSEPPRHAIFDFDGTLSLIRRGWPDVMTRMMVEVLLDAGAPETSEELAAATSEPIMRLAGKQTIYQMIWLAEEVRRLGGTPLDPLDYKRLFDDRLSKTVDQRRSDLASGVASPKDWVVPGSHALLDELRRRGVPLTMASGTDEAHVRTEAELLKIADYFEGRIHGARDDYQASSKAMVIDRTLAEFGIEGSSLLGFGDGSVEIDNVKQVGGTAIAVASDEEHRSGEADPRKRSWLIGVGADLVVPDHREHDRLLTYLWPVDSRSPDLPGGRGGRG